MTLRFVINPTTGALDLITVIPPTSGANFDNIVTSQFNSAGHLNVMYDPVSRTYLPNLPLVVIDNNGNVVTK